MGQKAEQGYVPGHQALLCWWCGLRAGSISQFLQSPWVEASTPATVLRVGCSRWLDSRPVPVQLCMALSHKLRGKPGTLGYGAPGSEHGRSQWSMWEEGSKAGGGRHALPWSWPRAWGSAGPASYHACLSEGRLLGVHPPLGLFAPVTVPVLPGVLFQPRVHVAFTEGLTIEVKKG